MPKEEIGDILMRGLIDIFPVGEENAGVAERELPSETESKYNND